MSGDRTLESTAYGMQYRTTEVHPEDADDTTVYMPDTVSGEMGGFRSRIRPSYHGWGAFLPRNYCVSCGQLDPSQP